MRGTAGSGPAAERALGWLLAQANEQGVPRLAGDARRSATTTGRCLPTLLAYGERELALDWGHWLVEQAEQIDELGPGAADAEELGSILCGLLAIEPALPEAKRPARKIAQRLIDWISLEESVAPLFLPQLKEASRRWQENRWKKPIRAAEGRLRMMRDWKLWAKMPGSYASMMATLLDLGQTGAAEAGLKLLYSMDRLDGAIESPSGPRIDTTELAQLAICWYRLGWRKRADRAMVWLVAHQHASGGFEARWPRRWMLRPIESVWTAKFFLDAALLQVRAAFEAAGDKLPDEIDADDGRYRAVRDWLEPLIRPGLKVADIGCGSGRFLNRLHEEFDSVKFFGIDDSTELLKELPRGVRHARGHLLNLPQEDAAYDAVFCVEALEHSLVPENAVGELCRVTAAGGRVLIIDKQQSKQPLSECAPWERWFTPEEVSGWLSAYCRDVEVREISHGVHEQPTGLFLCWTAVRE